jgi:hypothetical protein
MRKDSDSDYGDDLLEKYNLINKENSINIRNMNIQILKTIWLGLECHPGEYRKFDLGTSYDNIASNSISPSGILHLSNV